MKDACSNTTMVRMTVSNLPSTETGVHKHRTSTVAQIGLQDIPGTERCLYNLQRTSITVKTALSDLPSTETGVDEHQRTSTLVETAFQVPGSETPSTETAVHKHRTTSTVVEMWLQDILGTERCLYNLHDGENDFI